MGGGSFHRWLRRQARRIRSMGRGAVIALPYAWLLAFFLIPFVIVLKIALAEADIAQPPYTPLWEWIEGQYLNVKINLGNFAFLIQDSLYWKAYLNSVKVALVSTLLCLLLGYPIAYGIARASPARRTILLMLVILPFWTSFLIRVYAWIGILKNNGLINNFLMWLGVIDSPIVMLQTDFAVYLGIVYSYLPFMILPLYANLEKLDETLLEAAYDLGCRPASAFLRVTLPLSVPGIIAGAMLVFIPAVGEFVIPALLGAPDTLMIGRILWDEFFGNRDWPVASAVAIALLLLLVIPIVILQHTQARNAEARS
ncbi:MAG: spermidine/putrescine ABC transporter permease [Gammaproteobacteria bacterium SG8_31]|nr:MAG: spermidine/putrescine ABC transporter permease [Gammaproteobacteria bacterium SG8_31]